MTASKWTGTRLEALSARAARLVEAPHEIGGTFEKVFGGLYRFFGWQAKFASKSLRELVDTVRRDGTIEAALLKDAVEETGDNMALAERAVAIHGYVPAAHASWLSRVVETLQRIDHLIEDGSKQAARVLAGVDTTRMLPPLRIQAERAKDDPELETVLEKPDRARLLELQLAAIDHIMEAARSETQVIERRRRLLEGARRLLLDATAALPIDMEGARDRERFLASEITKLDRLQAAGLDAKVAVLYQAKQAVRRGDRDKLHAALVAMDSFALAVGDGAASGFTGRALDELAGGPGRYTERWEDGDHIRESLDRSAEQIFGRRIVSSIAEQYSLARKRFEASDTTNVDAELRSLALDYLAPGSEGEALAALVSVDGCFEVGGALSAVRATELETIARIVAHPTPEMLTMTAHGIEDVRQAVIEDPRTILLDLAAGRLLARKFVQRIQRPVTRTRLVGEARVYVLDGSTSMLSQGLEQSRARMRDAIMVAELATMLRRLEEPGRSVRLSLFYRYFTLKLGELRCVRTPGEVVAALADVVGTPRKGGTDIQAALLSSFALIRDAKREDPDLARASIVLITDGEAPVDGELVRRAREEASDVAISVSVIALGEENPVLRQLVARQRARGERAFYHHMDDRRLADLCRGEATRFTVHGRFEEVGTDAWKHAIDDVLVELDDLEASRRNRLRGNEYAEATASADGARALEEAAARDHHALERRYARWFPRLDARTVPVAAMELTTEEAGDRDAVRIVLSTVAEVVGELGGDALHRRSDAIELAERLLLDSRLSPARYRGFLESFGNHLADELEAVHAAVAGPDASFAHRLESAAKTT